MPRQFGRQQRVASQLQRLLNELLQFEVKDPALASVQVTEVQLTNDLGVARVFFATLVPDEDPSAAMAAFARASGFIRGRVGHALSLRRVPEIRFVHDDSVRRGFELAELIDANQPED